MPTQGWVNLHFSVLPAWRGAAPVQAAMVSAATFAVGAALLLVWRHPARAVVGLVTAALFVAVFPGNIDQYAARRDSFGLDTDGKRLARLFGQPALIAAALWSAGLPRS